MLSTLPFVAIGLIANILSPGWFAMGFGVTGVVIGIVLLAVGVPAWLCSVAMILIHVPRKKLITTGPFAVVVHPIYTSVALLVLPWL